MRALSCAATPNQGQAPPPAALPEPEADMPTFHAIPYATAARFCPPVPLDFAGLPDPGRPRGPVCPQAPSRLAGLMGPAAPLLQSEDCLSLTVTTPALTGARPVLVFLHGGAYLTGGGELPWYDAGRLSAEEDLVVVSVSYRLGAFGYLRRPGERGPGNGLRDQMAALGWVCRHIAAFGGDPGRVTVAGQSAGAHAVGALLAWGEGGRLFDRAMLLSHPPQGLLTEATARAVHDRVCALLGEDPAAVTAEALVAAAAHMRPGLRLPLPFAPVAPAAGEVDAVRPVPVLASYTRDDALPFTAGYGPARGWWDRGKARLATALLFRRAALQAVRGARAGGQPAWLCRIDYAPSAAFGAPHGIELPLLFGDAEAWGRAPMLGETPWPAVDAAGRTLRQLVGRFIRGTLPAEPAELRIGGRADQDLRPPMAESCCQSRASSEGIRSRPSR